MLVLLLVTVPLTYLAINPVRLVKVVFQPAPRAQITLTRLVALTRSYSGVAYVDWYGEITDETIKKVTVKLRPQALLDFVQSGEYEVRDGVMRGVLQLGSREWPLVANEDYTMLVLDATTGRGLLDGQISATVISVAGGDQWAILLIGLSASLIQIGDAVARWLFGQPPPN